MIIFNANYSRKNRLLRFRLLLLIFISSIDMSYSQIEYMGTYEGYQHSYYMYSIPTPGSNFFFKILPNNSVSLKQTSDEGR